MTGRFYLANYHRQAYRDIYPRWAQVFDLTYNFFPLDRAIYGSDMILRTAFYFPVPVRNSSLRVRVESERENFGDFLSLNNITFPRGYNNRYDFIATKPYFISSDYVIPLLYPDLNIGSLFYLKRIRSGFFYDYLSGKGNYIWEQSGQDSQGNPVFGHVYHNTVQSFRSFGMELLSDFYLLRIPFLMSGGVQASWQSFGTVPAIKVLFNIDIYGLTLGRRRI